MLLIPHIQKAKCSVSGPAHKQPGKRDSGPVLIQLSPKSLPIPQSGTSKLSNWTVVFVLVYIHRAQIAGITSPPLGSDSSPSAISTGAISG